MFCSTKYVHTDKTEKKTYRALEKGVLLRALLLTLDMSIALKRFGQQVSSVIVRQSKNGIRNRDAQRMDWYPFALCGFQLRWSTAHKKNVECWIGQYCSHDLVASAVATLLYQVCFWDILRIETNSLKNRSFRLRCHQGYVLTVVIRKTKSS